MMQVIKMLGEFRTITMIVASLSVLICCLVSFYYIFSLLVRALAYPLFEMPGAGGDSFILVFILSFVSSIAANMIDINHHGVENLLVSITFLSFVSVRLMMMLGVYSSRSIYQLMKILSVGVPFLLVVCLAGIVLWVPSQNLDRGFFEYFSLDLIFGSSIVAILASEILYRLIHMLPGVRRTISSSVVNALSRLRAQAGSEWSMLALKKICASREDWDVDSLSRSLGDVPIEAIRRSVMLLANYGQLGVLDYTLDVVQTDSGTRSPSLFRRHPCFYVYQSRFLLSHRETTQRYLWQDDQAIRDVQYALRHFGDSEALSDSPLARLRSVQAKRAQGRPGMSDGEALQQTLDNLIDALGSEQDQTLYSVLHLVCREDLPNREVARRVYLSYPTAYYRTKKRAVERILARLREAQMLPNHPNQDWGGETSDTIDWRQSR